MNPDQYDAPWFRSSCPGRMNVVNISIPPWAKFDDPGRPPDQHERERDGGVDRAVGDAVERQVENAARVRTPGRRGGACRRRRARRRVLGGHDPAEVEHDAAVGDGQRAARVLLDQQHGQPGARRAGRAAAPMICAAIRGARPSDGSSSSSSRGRAISARPMREHLALAAGERVRPAVPPLGQRREQLVDLARAPSPCRARRATAPPSRRFSSTVSSVITPRPSGTCAMPVPHDRPRPAVRARSRPSRVTRPARGRTSP